MHLSRRLDKALSSGAADTVQEQEGLQLSLRKLKHICKRLVGGKASRRNDKKKKNATTRDDDDDDDDDDDEDDRLLSRAIHDTLLTSLMSSREQKIVETCLADCQIKNDESRTKRKKHAAAATNTTNVDHDDDESVQLDAQLLEACRRTPQQPLLVPNPTFEVNPGHARVLREILNAHFVGERALLIMGYQGVGKNRVVDYLLSQLQCEREYVQLHRDTSVQSLLAVPVVQDGRVVYQDSPLVRAAQHGRILVVDEADKAPVEVVALLKGLIEDGQLALPDGRILQRKEKHQWATEGEDEQQQQLGGKNSLGVSKEDGIIPIHPDFALWCLANPAGYPFHGNDLAREMADVFSCHTVPPLDAASQQRILQRYGPTVPSHQLDQIIDIWQDLAKAHRKGLLAYPFSVREAVSVVKHLEQFPSDGLNEAIENVIAFDRFDSPLLKQLSSIFAQHGIEGVTFGGRTTETLLEQTQGGISSTPRTGTDMPKHGKVDPDNTPHVGGNTWAGGTGGSDTAGLGGRGGPYRLDAGHPIHQVSDEMKAQVTEEAQRRARQMAEQALDEKLKDLDMGKLDWERYEGLRERVSVQIQQLEVLLKDIERRKEERVWLKRQSYGELDDARLVDALAGEKDVFKRRGVATNDSHFQNDDSGEPESIRIKLVVDVSASMYRFNSYDGRLERLLEATLMIMEALKDDNRFELEIVGHNGTSAEIPFLNPFDARDAKTQLKILESMVAHTQYTWAGDSTLEALDLAVTTAGGGDLVILISDANLQRYRISAHDVSDILQQGTAKDVHTHLIFVGSMGKEAHILARNIPNERAQVCMNTQDLPVLLKGIVASAAPG